MFRGYPDSYGHQVIPSAHEPALNRPKGPAQELGTIISSNYYDLQIMFFTWFPFERKNIQQLSSLLGAKTAIFFILHFLIGKAVIWLPFFCVLFLSIICCWSRKGYLQLNIDCRRGVEYSHDNNLYF